MSAFSYFLAGRRTAPVQAVGWGHPDTTGIDTIDYYVSAASIEPENAQQNYTERLVRLLRLPCHYQTPPAPGKVPTRNELGLPESGTLYGCPQSLFKFHPDFDGVLAAIAEGDAGGHIVLLESAQAAWVAQLRARWAKTYPILKARVLFLPRQPLQKFMALLAHMDVLLDPVHFGSGNTLYEAMVYGTPVVTWPGNFMRGRIVSGAYRQMAVADAPVVAHIEEYAAMALALGRDPQRRRLIREASVEAARRELYEDRLAVREFECFLDTAVTAAGRGEILPTGWTPGIPAALTE
jgi:predicted O-linked N-acetylglucosamine transferase (SPINDLY family)